MDRYSSLTQVFRVGDFSLYDTRISMILIYCTFNLPIAIWILRPTVDAIRKQLTKPRLSMERTRGS